MISAAEMLRRLKTVSNITVLRELVYVEIKAEEKLLLDSKRDLYEKGDIYSNNTFSRYKNAEYGNMKYEMNPQAGGNVDLIFTGAFIESFYLLKPKQNKYLFNARNRKKASLVSKYGQEIMGFPQDLFESFQYKPILPKFIKALKQKANI